LVDDTVRSPVLTGLQAPLNSAMLVQLEIRAVDNQGYEPGRDRFVRTVARDLIGGGKRVRLDITLRNRGAKAVRSVDFQFRTYVSGHRDEHPPFNPTSSDKRCGKLSGESGVRLALRQLSSQPIAGSDPKSLVPREGLEPSRPYGHRILSPSGSLLGVYDSERSSEWQRTHTTSKRNGSCQ